MTQTSTQSPTTLLTPTPNPNDQQKINPQEKFKPRRSPRLHTSLTTEAIQSIALEDINNLQLHYPTLSPLIFSYFYDLISLKDKIIRALRPLIMIIPSISLRKKHSRTIRRALQR